MEFKSDILVDRELEIAYYFRHAFSMERIVEKTGMNRRILQGHVKNMREKLHAEDTASLIKIIQSLGNEEAGQLQASTLSTNSKIRESTKAYFESADAKTNTIGKRNMILIAIALLVGIGTVLFVCNTFMEMFVNNGFMNEFDELFAG